VDCIDCKYIEFNRIVLTHNDTMEKENECSKAFYALAVNIKKNRMLDRSRRQQEGAVYLEKTYAQYMTLMEKSIYYQDQLRTSLWIYLNLLKKKKTKTKTP
jgi:hypothetical protein